MFRRYVHVQGAIVSIFVHSFLPKIGFILDFYEHYTMNNFPTPMEIEEIAKQWNIDHFDYNINLTDWFFCRRMAEQAAAQRRYEAAKAAA